MGTEPGFAGTVPGAYKTDWRAFLDEVTDELKSVSEMAEMFRHVGVCDDTPVVVFGRWDMGCGQEGRIYWLLRSVLGHRGTYILEGGIFSWIQSGLVGSGRRVVGNLPPRSLRRWIDWRDVRDAMTTGDAILIDCRSIEEFEGRASSSEPRRGRIPTSVHYDWRNVFEEDDRRSLRGSDAIDADFRKRGIDRDQRVIVYCARGVRSAFLFAVMQANDYRCIENYAGSFSEWARIAELPVVANTLPEDASQ